MTDRSRLEYDPAIVQAATPAQTRWLKGLARLARIPLVLAATAPLLAGGLLVLQSWLLSGVLEAGFVHGIDRTALMQPLAWIVTLILMRAALSWAGERAGTLAAERIKHTVRQTLMRTLLAAGPTWTRRQASGELAGTVVEQTEALDGHFSRYLPSMAAAAILPIAFSLVILPVDLIAGLLLLATAPLIPLFMALVGWGAEAASRRHLHTFARLSGLFADRLRGLATLKLHGRAQAEATAVAQASDTLRARTLAVLRIAFLSSAVLEFFAALGVAGVAVYIGLSYLGYLDLRPQPLTLQAGFFCLLMAPEVYAPLRQFAAHYHDRAAARAAVAQIEDTFGCLPATDPATPQPTDSVQDTQAHAWSPERQATGLAVQAGPLRLSLPERPHPILNGLTLSARAGEHIALLGDSGAGKTSLLEVLARIQTADGPLSLDGRPLSEWPEAVLREQLILIGQRPYLLQGSIADNIRLGCANASPEAVALAAQRACVSDFAQHMPHGLDSQIDPRGQGLSGGQAQRVALARLYLRAPRLILLDEPTAHLDAATRDAVLDGLLDFARGRTLLLATHSAEVASRFPRRIQLAGGRIESAA
ncbi:MAG: thiol reductant ABC exporter subunit CydD [Castellaniella sp.]|uniref:thiol reductant ABC exporter subunit CydD n=1 Tax=Castellaniella sp. TaxID=1955812 RepID=UPI002A370BF9|nr:thiol reductant ABC exporter subunit CydD [Castellaniella sp.]MDY0308649.1 thiol reductant ABC exporter subunit CydD [Castellaniella sp.]